MMSSTTRQTSTRTTRALIGLGTAAALGLGVGVGVAAPAGASAPAPQAAAKRTVTFAVGGCEGCAVRLTDAPAQVAEVWQSKAKTVEDGSVTFTVPAEHSSALSAAIEAPWEGDLGYVTQIVFRYGGTQVGDDVTVAQARTKSRGSYCLADQGEGDVEVPITVRRARVQGVDGPTAGTRAFASTVPEYATPMNRIVNGVGGAQDVPRCG